MKGDERERLEPERLRVLAAELEDVAHLDAAGGDEGARPVGRRVALADLGRLDRAVGGEVATRDEVEDVAAVDVRPGHPRGAVDDAGVDEVADAAGVVLAEHAREATSRVDIVV